MVSVHTHQQWLLLLCASVVLCFESSAVAQRAPKEFFEKHYADKPHTAGEQQPEYAGREKVATRAPVRSASAGPSTTTPRVGREGGKVRGLQAQEKKRAQNGFLTVYVNSADKQHFERVIESTLIIAQKAQFYVASVVHIGDYRNVSEAVEQDVKGMGIALHAAGSPPPSLGISRSPAWVLYTPQGIHIVEGVVQFERFMTPMGEFSQQQQVAPAPPTPTPLQVEGF